MKASIDIVLGSAPEIYQLFSYANAGVPIAEVIAHSFNQTLQRDKFYGAWADVYYSAGDGQYHLRLSAPVGDLSAYETIIPAYLAAGRRAMEIFNRQGMAGANLQFLLPFGLAMAKVESLQLLHYPPMETFSFSDYLYSPTNSRWECLLANNGFDGARNDQLERVIDIVPIAAPGDDASGINPHDLDFVEYVKALMSAFLTVAPPMGEQTAAVVAGGGPVRDWLMFAFASQCAAAPGAKLQVLSLLSLPILEGRQTPLLCSNHPSKFLFLIDEDASASTVETRAQLLTVMRQDLIAAGWQAHMADFPQDNPRVVLATLEARWADDAAVQQIVDAQCEQFCYGS